MSIYSKTPDCQGYYTICDVNQIELCEGYPPPELPLSLSIRLSISLSLAPVREKCPALLLSPVLCIQMLHNQALGPSHLGSSTLSSSWAYTSS